MKLPHQHDMPCRSGSSSSEEDSGDDCDGDASEDAAVPDSERDGVHGGAVAAQPQSRQPAVHKQQRMPASAAAPVARAAAKVTKEPHRPASGSREDAGDRQDADVDAANRQPESEEGGSGSADRAGGAEVLSTQRDAVSSSSSEADDSEGSEDSDADEQPAAAVRQQSKRARLEACRAESDAVAAPASAPTQQRKRAAPESDLTAQEDEPAVAGRRNYKRRAPPSSSSSEGDDAGEEPEAASAQQRKQTAPDSSSSDDADENETETVPKGRQHEQPTTQLASSDKEGESGGPAAVRRRKPGHGVPASSSSSEEDEEEEQEGLLGIMPSSRLGGGDSDAARGHAPAQPGKANGKKTLGSTQPAADISLTAKKGVKRPVPEPAVNGGEKKRLKRSREAAATASGGGMPNSRNGAAAAGNHAAAGGALLQDAYHADRDGAAGGGAASDAAPGVTATNGAAVTPADALSKAERKAARKASRKSGGVPSCDARTAADQEPRQSERDGHGAGNKYGTKTAAAEGPRPTAEAGQQDVDAVMSTPETVCSLVCMLARQPFPGMLTAACALCGSVRA